MATTTTAAESTTTHAILDILNKLSRDEVLKLADFIIDKSIQIKISISSQNDSTLEQDKKSYLEDMIKEIQEKKIQYDVSILDPPKTERYSPSFEKSEAAYNEFVIKYANDPKYKDKFVGFVNGEFQGVDDKERVLTEKICAKCGNVDMYVGKVSTKVTIIDMGCRV